MSSSPVHGPSDARSLLQTLPLPLAQLVLRALNAKNAPERHHSAYYLAECTIKLAASARVGVWLEHAATPSGDIARKLESLVLPSTGHWCEILREVSRDLSERKNAAVLPLGAEYAELVRNRPSWTGVRKFVERSIAEGCVPADAAKKALKRGVIGFFDMVVAYRNDVIGHGALRTNVFYDELGELLLAATLEVLACPALFGRMELVHARRVTPDDHTTLEYHALTGLAGVPVGKAAVATAGQLYLMGAAGRITLYPLMLLQTEDELGRERVGFINRTLRRTRKSADGEVEEIRRADYLDYASGQALPGVDARASIGALLSTLRGKPLAEADIAAAANATMSDVQADASDDAVEESAIIGDFELLGELGRGAMGIVYKARQQSLKRIVALKVLPPSLSEDPIARKRFAREISALARCDHPNVVKILASGEDGPRLYYAMEYVEGADLARAFEVLSSWRGNDTILREGHLAAAVSTFGGLSRSATPESDLPEVERIPPAPILTGRDLAERLTELFAQVADGLAHLHASGVIHRDLKPGNLMLTADGKRIVIMDLGLAKLADESKALTSADVKILGTLRYMAPEQLQRRLLDVDARADIYSLGATLYELVTGKRVFDGDTEQRLIYQVLHEVPMAPQRVDRRISPELSAVLSVAMSKTAADRYATAQAFADDLRAVAQRRPIRARPPGLLRRTTLWVSRTSAGRGVALATVLLVALVPPAVIGIRSALAPRQCAADSVADCSKQCDRGHPGSCYALGAMYESGGGVARDEARAAPLYSRACEGGHWVACYSLGHMREVGKGIDADIVDAARLFGLACDGGNAQGCNSMGRMNQYGSGVKLDLARAATLYKQSCDGGYATACSNLGRLSEDGTGVAKDGAAAHALYEKACGMGSAAGCGSLATAYSEGIYVKKDEARAFSLFKTGCDGGYGFACAGLGAMYQDGNTVTKDVTKAAALYKRGCDDNYPPAFTLLGRLVDAGNGVPKDEGRARVLFQQGCEWGDSSGCYHLAEMAETGRSITKDEARAAKLYDGICTKGTLLASCVALARMYADGRGVTADAAKATALMKQACVAGETSACVETTESAHVDVKPMLTPNPAPPAIWAPTSTRAHPTATPASRGSTPIADRL